MKILFVSMNSIHFVRWIENLKDSEHDLYWFDVLDRGELQTFPRVKQYAKWKERKMPYIKGEYFLKKKMSTVFNIIQPLLEVTIDEKLKQIIEEINPDVVHSFEMQNCSYPILRTMKKFPNLKWIYSCWGNDLYYYKDLSRHNAKLRKVLQRVDYLQADCERDCKLAVGLGFSGYLNEVIPGGTGYMVESLAKHKKEIAERKIILIKGYQHIFGRALIVVQEMEKIQLTYPEYEIVIFGAHQEVCSFIENKKLPFKFFTRNELSQQELLQLMGQSLLYIGNSISDGIPNTLLEAIVMGAFPIQSNPGNATAEIIADGINGFLINDPKCNNEIYSIICKALNNKSLIAKAYAFNENIAKLRLDYAINNIKVNNLYRKIVNESRS